MASTNHHSQSFPNNADMEEALIEQAIAWFMRKEASDFSDSERQEFLTWLNQDPSHHQAFQRVERLWNSPNMDQAATRLSRHIEREKKKDATSRGWKIPVRPVAMAASVLLVSFALWTNDVFTWIQADYSTNVGGQRVVTLPDQSILTLNTNTAIAIDFSANRRKVKVLCGEASFAVQPDADRPFIVEMHGVTATALGTEFQVRERGGRVQVTVLEGSVKVAGSAEFSAQSVRLDAGQEVLVGPQGPGAVEQIDIAASSAWKNGQLVFVAAPLQEVVAEVSRYHRGYIAIWNPDLYTMPVTGIYHTTDPSRLITTLSDTLPIQVVRITDHLIIIQ